MIKSSIEIRPATAADIRHFSDKPCDKTIKAMVVLKDGEIAALSGITIERDRLVAFSDVKNVDASKFTVWRVAKELMAFISKNNLPVFAMTDSTKPNSGKFLERLGFHYEGECEDGTIYRLQPWQS